VIVRFDDLALFISPVQSQLFEKVHQGVENLKLALLHQD
jgi:hypothetical protein